MKGKQPILNTYVYFLVALNLFSPIFGQTANNSDLILDSIQLVFRHGARTLSSKEVQILYPKNPRLIPQSGYAELNNVGMKEMFKLGRFLRIRYGEFFGNFNYKDIYGYSSNHSRTVKSLKCILAGLILPDKEETIKNLMVKTPQIADFYIRVVPSREDVLLKSHYAEIFTKKVLKIVESSEFQDKLQSYQSTLEVVKNNVGCGSEIVLKDQEKNNSSKQNTNCTFRIYPGALMRSIFNALNNFKMLNMSLPNWCNEKVLQDIEKMSIISLQAATATLELTRMNIGPLLKEILANLNDKNPRKMYLYSGHDYNIAALLAALEVDKFVYPGLGSALIIEAWHTVHDKDKRFVRIKGWSGTGNDTIALKMKHCEEPCYQDKFETILEPMIPSDDELTCLKNSLAVPHPSLIVY